jgi:hypothetical protein
MQEDFSPRPQASAQSMHPQMQQHQQMHQTLSPQNNYADHAQSMRNLDVARIPTNVMRDSQQRKSMFASGERGNRYRMDPDQNGQPEEQLSRSFKRMDSGGSDSRRNNAQNMQRQQMMTQQRMYQSMVMPMQRNHGSEFRDDSVNHQLTASRQQMIHEQQQQTHPSIRRGSFGSGRNSHSSRTGSQSSRRQMMQQQQMHQSMQLPRNKDLRRSWDRQRSEQQQFSQSHRSIHSANASSIHSEGGVSRRAISDKAVAESFAPTTFTNSRQQFPPQPDKGPRRSFDSQSEGARPQLQRSNLAKSMVIQRNKYVTNLAGRRSFQDHKREQLTSGIAGHYQPLSRKSFHDKSSIAGHYQPQSRKSFHDKSSTSNQNGLDSSLRSSGRRSAVSNNQMIANQFPHGNIESLLNSSSPSGLNLLNVSVESSGRHSNLPQNQTVANQLSGSLRSGRYNNPDRLSISERSGRARLNPRPDLNTHHSSILPRRRRSWVRDEENKLRASMGNVLVQSDRSELRDMMTLIGADSGIERGLIPDDNDLSDDDLIGGAVPLQNGIQKSFVSQSDTYRSSLTEKGREASGSGRTGEETTSRFGNIRDSIQNRRSSRWKTLSEDNSRINYRRALVGLIIGGIVLGGVITAAIFLSPFDTSDKTANLEDDSVPSEREFVLPIPVRDIAGRCSPSNIHGSMAACVEACSMAACCYPGFSGRACYDETNPESVEACFRYRPYCDAIFSPWAGALAGEVAPPPSDLFNRAQWNEVCIRGAVSTSVHIPFKKRHHISGVSGQSRFLGEAAITPHVCEFACLPGRCCIAPRASAAGAGLYMTSDGVVKNATNDDYVETSCMNDKNPHCVLYTEKCSLVMQSWAEEAVDSTTYTYNPTVAVTAATPVSPVTTDLVSSPPLASTLLPTGSESDIVDTPQGNGDASVEPSQPQFRSTSKPSDNRTSKPTSQPTQAAPSIPLPKVNEIKKVCTGTQTVLDIVEGVLNAVTHCQKVCQPGLCCFADTDASCFEANREVCMAYSDCAVLSMTADDVAALDSSKEAPPEPTTDLSMFCSTSATKAGVFECVKQCQPASCCGAVHQETSCFDEYEETCALYGPCLELIDANGGDTKSMPPAPPADLSYTCSYSNINVDSSECSLACSAGLCCSDNSCGPFEDEEAIKERCELYEPCNNLLPLSMPSEDLQVLCDSTTQIYDEQSCSEACSASSCCFVDNHDPCWANFEESCEAYSRYCAPASVGSDVAIVQVQEAPSTLEDLCVGATPSPECKQACSSGACCFLTSEDNCWPNNELACGEYYAVCAFLYQDYQEGEDQFA